MPAWTQGVSEGEVPPQKLEDFVFLKLESCSNFGEYFLALI